jgi:DNA mismatch endonuclease (patch repair protein)
LIGRPDFVIPRARVAVFIDGCFWHGCPDHFTMPVTRRAFWKRKIENNRARDAMVAETLRAEGWRVVRVWEHEIEKDPILACKAVLKEIRRRPTPRT